MSFFAALPFIQAGTSGLKYLLDRQKMNRVNQKNEQALQTANLQSAISQSGRAPRQFQANLQEFKPGAMSNFLGAVGTAAGLAQTGKALYDQGQRAAQDHANKQWAADYTKGQAIGAAGPQPFAAVPKTAAGQIAGAPIAEGPSHNITGVMAGLPSNASDAMRYGFSSGQRALAQQQNSAYQAAQDSALDAYFRQADLDIERKKIKAAGGKRAADAAAELRNVHSGAATAIDRSANRFLRSSPAIRQLSEVVRNKVTIDSILNKPRDQWTPADKLAVSAAYTRMIDPGGVQRPGDVEMQQMAQTAREEYMGVLARYGGDASYMVFSDDLIATMKATSDNIYNGVADYYNPMVDNAIQTALLEARTGLAGQYDIDLTPLATQVFSPFRLPALGGKKAASGATRGVREMSNDDLQREYARAWGVPYWDSGSQRLRFGGRQ